MDNKFNLIFFLGNKFNSIIHISKNLNKKAKTKFKDKKVTSSWPCIYVIAAYY